MDEQIQRAFDAYRSAVEAEQALSSAIAAEQRQPSAEEAERFERMEEDITSTKREYQRLAAIASRKAELDAARAGVERFIANDPVPSADRKVEAETDIRRLAAAWRAASTQPVAFDAPYTSADMTRLATRALTVSGSAVDSTFINQVLLYETDESPMLDPAVCQQLVTARGETITWPRLTAYADFAGTLTAEEAAFTAADPTLSTVTFNAYKYGGITLWSAELDQDEVIGLQDVLARAAARKIGEDANAPLTTGTGSNQPNGIVTAAGNGGTALGTAQTGGDNFFGWPDLVTLQYSVKAAYRRRGNFMAGTTALAKIRKFRDANGAPVWTPSVVPGQPEMLLGRPIYENPDMAAAASASKSVLFGDTQRYVVRRVGQARVELSRDYAFSTDQVALKVVERLDGDLLDGSAVNYLVSATS